MPTFLIFVESRNGNVKTSDKHYGDKFRRFRHFFNKKIITQKVFIWLLKWNVLARNIQWLIWKRFKDHYGPQNGTCCLNLTKHPKLIVSVEMNVKIKNSVDYTSFNTFLTFSTPSKQKFRKIFSHQKYQFVWRNKSSCKSIFITSSKSFKSLLTEFYWLGQSWVYVMSTPNWVVNLK